MKRPSPRRMLPPTSPNPLLWEGALENGLRRKALTRLKRRPTCPGQGCASFFAPFSMRAAINLNASAETHASLRRALLELFSDSTGPIRVFSDAGSLAVDFRGRFRGDLCLSKSRRSMFSPANMRVKRQFFIQVDFQATTSQNRIQSFFVVRTTFLFIGHWCGLRKTLIYKTDDGNNIKTSMLYS